MGLIPPLILMLYFLKLRRTPVEVPSTYLWTRAIEDLHVNSIWQRLRNSLLLILQLLLAILLILACLRPGCPGEELTGERFIFMIDNSASMSAADVEGAESRLEKAKDEVRNLIERMKPNDTGMLISFSDRAIVQQSYTKNKSLLKRKLNSITQSERSSQIQEALVAASGLADPGRVADKNIGRDVQVADALEAKLFIYSDGGVASDPNFALTKNLQVEYHPIGAFEPPHNVGITAFSINDQLENDNQVQAFVQLMNSDDEDHTVTVTLYVNDEVFDVQAGISIEKERTRSLNFDLGGLVADLTTPVPVRVEIDDKDVYAQDNVAYTVLNPPRLANVLVVTELNRFLETACKTSAMKKLAEIEFVPESFMNEKEFLENATLGIYDLVIFDNCVPAEMPLCNTVFFGAKPPGDNWQFGEKNSPAPVFDYDTSHPLMYSLQLNNVTIAEAHQVTGPEGSSPLMESAFGPMMAIGPRGGFEDLVIGFPLLEYDENGDSLVNTDWPNRLSFPLFMQNMVSILGGRAKFNATQGNKPGQLVTIRSKFPYSSITVKGPAKDRNKLRPRSDNSFVFPQTERSGIYEVTDTDTGDVDQLFSINLLDRRESNVNVREKLEIGYEEFAGSPSEFKPARQEYWFWLVAVALLILVVEWYIYNRRVFI